MDNPFQYKVLEGSMRFVRIEMLFLIWAVPVLFFVFFGGMRKRSKILDRFASLRGLEAIVPEAGNKRRWVKAGLVLCTLFFALLALSGPQYGYRWEEIEQKGIDIIVAMDCSRSMLAEDIRPTRLDRARREVFDLLAMLKGDRVGLVAFAGTAFLQCPLTIDYEAFNLFLNALSPDFLPIGGTDIAGAVQAALGGFNQEDKSEKAVILITDGESTGGDPVQAAKAAAKAGVKLFCIGVGKEGGVPVPDKTGGFAKDNAGKIILAKLDEDTLKKMAAVTGGAYVRSVAGDMDLDAVYTREIRGKMEASTFSGGRRQVWEDRYQWVLGLAILALIVELFIPSAKKKAFLFVLLVLLCSIHPISTGSAYASGVQKNLRQGLEAYEKADYESALKFFIKAQLEDPERPEIFYNIANAYYKIGDFDSARDNYKKAIESKKKDLKHNAYYNLGNSDYRAGKFEDAVSDYQKALKIDPDDQETAKNLELAQKMMEKQKEQNQQQSSDKNQKQDDGSDQKKSEEQSKDQPEDNKNPSEQQNASDDPSEKNKSDKAHDGDQTDKLNQEKDEESQDQAAQADKENGGADQADKSPEPVDSKDREGKKQAERILNRLQDRPGGAMIP
ncbi:MAG: VWA domain-containing protein, partial [Deltaproteobacteria bacterium]|nr:VWA domain-containing protein [Deltaproteobacteria bacterium]